MFALADLKSLHLEITNRCQAACPMCSRNYHGGMDNVLLKNADWNFNDFENIVLPVAKQLTKINFCGNFGDPLLNINLQIMTDAVKHLNIHVDVHTNGSLRNDKWWAAFPKHLPVSHRVVFGIDGLADTHSIYRIGTDFNRILENAKTFIQAGGIAEWCFIRFKHNEHQVEDARELAKKYGFKYFSVKDSSRFNFEKQFAVYNKYGKTEYYLESPINTDTKYFDANNLTLIQNLVNDTEINCYAQHQTELYIDAHRRIMPCCFLAAIPYDYYRKNDSLQKAKDVVKVQYRKLLNDLGDTTGTIESVLESKSFQTVWKQYWTINKLWTCARTCGNKFNRPNDQIQSYQVL
jgi:MoaA/NifB/PqqE/SkfB family radical SAM enzyme